MKVNISDPKTWPLDIMLPLENPSRGCPIDHLGLIITPYIIGKENQFRVLTLNMYDISDFRIEALLKLPHEQYSSEEELLKAGWRVN